jgi:hypothetical protein
MIDKLRKKLKKEYLEKLIHRQAKELLFCDKVNKEIEEMTKQVEKQSNELSILASKTSRLMDINNALEDIIEALLTVYCQHCEKEQAAALKKLYDEKYEGRDLLKELNLIG